jgi:cytochrome P450
MLNDVHDYPEPHEFKPERYLKNGKLDSSVRDPMDIAFGFGRRLDSFHLVQVHVSSSTNISTVLGRICPGKHITHSIVTLAAASVLSTFDLVRKVDENGQQIKPKREYTKSSALR